MREPFYTTLGRDFVSLNMPNGRQAAGIIIDNPSGSWLHVEGVDRYVPPYVMGWAFPFQPSVASVTVRFVDSPSGSLSQLVGNAPTVFLTDEPTPAFQGTPSGAGARVTTVPIFQVAAQALIADLPNLVVPTVMLTAVRPIVLRRLAFTYDLRDLGGATAGYDPRAIVSIVWEGLLGSTFFWQQAIAPETPYVNDELTDGSAILPANSVLQVAAIVQFSGAEYAFGQSDVQTFAFAQYYEEAAP